MAGQVLATIRNDVDGIIQLLKVPVRAKGDKESVDRYYLRFWVLGKEGLVDAHTVPMYQHEAIQLTEALLTALGVDTGSKKAG